MLEELIFVCCFKNDKCVIYISLPEGRGCGAVSRALVSKCSMYILAIMGLSGDPLLHLLFAHNIALEKQSRYFSSRTPTA